MDDELKEWADGRLPEPMNKSAWYRYAVETTLMADEHLDQLYERYQLEKRQDFIEKAVQEKVERKKKEINHMD